MGAICLTESDERVRPRAALKSASDERPKHCSTSVHFSPLQLYQGTLELKTRRAAWSALEAAASFFRYPDIVGQRGILTAPTWVPIWGPGSPWGPFPDFGSPFVF